MNYNLGSPTIGKIDVTRFQSLMHRKDGDCIAYMFDIDVTSRVVGRLLDAAGDTEAMIQNGDSSFYLAENDDGNQLYFDELKRNLKLTALRYGKAIIGAAVHESKYLPALMQALNNEPITLPDAPKHVGTWVFVVTPQQEFIKWGTNGDTVFPYPPDDKEAVRQAKYLSKSSTHKDDVIYILHVFDNGQMKQFEYER